MSGLCWACPTSVGSRGLRGVVVDFHRDDGQLVVVGLRQGQQEPLAERRRSHGRFEDDIGSRSQGLSRITLQDSVDIVWSSGDSSSGLLVPPSGRSLASRSAETPLFDDVRRGLS